MPDEPDRIEVERLGPNMLAARPFSVGVVVAMLILTGGVFCFVDSHSAEITSMLLFGFTQGQIGALSVWVFSRRVKKKMLFAMGSLLVGFAAGYLTGHWTYSGFSNEELFVYALQFVALQLSTMGGLLAYHAVARAKKGLRAMQFAVQHLLVLMVATCLLGTTIGFSWEALRSLDVTVAMRFLCWTAITIAAGILLLDTPVSLWRLALFASIGLVFTYLCPRFNVIISTPTSVVHMTTLAFCIVMPQFDHSFLKLTASKPDGKSPGTSPDEEKIGESDVE